MSAPLGAAEVAQFWREFPPLYPDDGVCEPSLQEPEPECLFDPHAEAGRAFASGALIKRPWTSGADAAQEGEPTLWVYRRSPVKYSVESEKEYLFVVFSRPFASGLPMPFPRSVALPAQTGRWEVLNPRTVSFSPDSGVVEFAELVIDGKSRQVRGVAGER